MIDNTKLLWSARQKDAGLDEVKRYFKFWATFKSAPKAAQFAQVIMNHADDITTDGKRVDFVPHPGIFHEIEKVAKKLGGTAVMLSPWNQ